MNRDRVADKSDLILNKVEPNRIKAEQIAKNESDIHRKKVNSFYGFLVPYPNEKKINFKSVITVSHWKSVFFIDVC